MESGAPLGHLRSRELNECPFSAGSLTTDVASNRVCAALQECLRAPGAVGLPFREGSEEALADLQRLGEALSELGYDMAGKATRELLCAAVCVLGVVASLCPKGRSAASEVCRHWSAALFSPAVWRAEPA